MSDFIDLDALLPDDIPVKLGGVTYKLPGDPPVELLLRLQLLAQKIDEAQDAAPEELLKLREELAAEIEELFSLRNELSEDEPIQLTDRQTAGLLEQLFEKYFAVEEDGDRPTSTKAKPKSSRPSARKSPARARRAAASSTSSQT